MVTPKKVKARNGAAVRVAAYARVSTMNQVRERDSSVDTQLAAIRKKVEYECEQSALQEDGAAWTIVDEYREEGRSAKNTSRPELQRLLADVRLGKLDVVVVTKIDRITRSLTDFHDLWNVFSKHGVEFVSLGDQFETRSAAGRAMLSITLIFAQLERERTSERTREKVMARRAGGLWFGGSIPLGYRPHPTDKTSLAVDEEWAGVVKQMFETYLSAGSGRALVRYLSKRGITTPRRTSRRGSEKGGAPFTVQTVLNILSSSVYVGERELDDGATVQANWPAIIDRPVFERVKAKLASSSVERPSGKVPSGHVYLLDGRLRCASCGSMMTRGEGTGRGGKRYFYYRCSGKTRSAATSCNARDIPVDAVETFVIGQLKKYALDPRAIRDAVGAANAGRDRDLAKLDAEIKAAKASLLAACRATTALVDAVERDAVEDGGRGGVGLRARLREREAASQGLRLEVEDLQLRRDALRQKILDDQVVAENYERLSELLDEARDGGAHELLRGLLHTVVDVVEWKEDSADPRRGTASILLYDLPEGFWAMAEGQKDEQPSEPPSISGSLSCLNWLPSVDLNHGPDD